MSVHMVHMVVYQFEHMTYITIVPNNMCGENLSFKLPNYI